MLLLAYYWYNTNGECAHHCNLLVGTHEREC